jgi:probable F420-dependent oxidoreductase
MKIGLFLPTFDAGLEPDVLAALGETAEAVGAASLWVPEHVILTDTYASRYPYADDGKLPVGGGSGGPADPMVVLSFLAARTRRVRLGTGICLVPQRNPLYTAKEIATLDVLSRGRVDFGIGIGWLAEEFAALEVPFARRAGRTRAYLEIMRRLWSDGIAEHTSEFYTLPPVRMDPKPIQRPHPPILVGGESDAALGRAAEYGQGWFGWHVTPEMVGERVGALTKLLAGRGRRIDDLRVLASPYLRPTRDLDAMKRYRDAGAGEVVVLLSRFQGVDGARAVVERVGERLIAPAEAL